MVRQGTSSRNQVFILVAPGFEERPVVEVLTRLRQAGLSVSLVSLTVGPINSQNGLTVKPDATIGQVLVKNHICQLVIVPGGHRCVSVLLTDPRVYQLLEKTLDGDGYVAATSQAQSAVVNSGIPALYETLSFVPQETMSLGEFSQKLMSLLGQPVMAAG